jgi:hypothetical protein
MAELSDFSKKARRILQNPSKKISDIHSEVSSNKKKSMASKMRFAGQIHRTDEGKVNLPVSHSDERLLIYRTLKNKKDYGVNHLKATTITPSKFEKTFRFK